jgi:SulP family sulfate permease
LDFYCGFVGVVIGVVLSMIWLVAVSALPKIPELGRKTGTLSYLELDDYPDAQTIPGLSILRFDGGLFFVNADALGDRIREVNTQADPPLNGVILDMEGVNFIDVEGADIIKKIAQTGAAHNVDLYLAHLKTVVKNILERDGVINIVGSDHIHDRVAAAVAMHLKKFPSDQVDFQDLLDLLDKAKSGGGAEHD